MYTYTTQMLPTYANSTSAYIGYALIGIMLAVLFFIGYGLLVLLANKFVSFNTESPRVFYNVMAITVFTTCLLIYDLYSRDLKADAKIQNVPVSATLTNKIDDGTVACGTKGRETCRFAKVGYELDDGAGIIWVTVAPNQAYPKRAVFYRNQK